MTHPCFHCGVDVVAILDGPVAAFTLRAQMTTYTGALLAIAAGRRAVAGTVTKTSTVWGRLHAYRIPANGRPPAWASVFAAEHRCDHQLPPPPPKMSYAAATTPPF
jgi:hypothetical protein